MEPWPCILSTAERKSTKCRNGARKLSDLQIAHKPSIPVQVWGAAEINLGYELSEDHKRVLLLVLKVCFNLTLGAPRPGLHQHHYFPRSKAI